MAIPIAPGFFPQTGDRTHPRDPDFDFIGLAGGLTADDLNLELDNGNTIISIESDDGILGVVAGVAPARLMGRFVPV
ncbi:MAG: hypothetical protein EBE86_032235 [Hormoscilla sp. GUM202]|nr:hypothetical protein [Hormoscilla sp. GM7CHS1pb]MBO1351749.1 hypothetical protein [Hormoscilla sp. GUM202]